MVLGGTHQFESWTSLPGPRAWLPITLAILAFVCFPVWVFFHAGTLGTFVAWLTSTTGALNGAGHFVWGVLLLGVVTLISLKGGYSALEKIQLLITVLMLW
jgi:hypothetical protein